MFKKPKRSVNEAIASREERLTTAELRAVKACVNIFNGRIVTNSILNSIGRDLVLELRKGGNE